MNNYRITGRRTIAGRQPGTTLTDDDLTGCNIAALVRGGHLSPIPNRPNKADTHEEN